MIVKKEYERWLQHPGLDPLHKEILEKMDEATKQDSFYTNLTFGTAGMRGLLGLGPNRMNLYTLRKANQGFLQYLCNTYPEVKEKGIVIGYDNRHMSYEFALDSAKLFAAHGIRTYLFDALRPTPLLSFAVRYYHCLGGIMITASHNPKEYNGYKLYDEQGCQLVPALAKQVIQYVEAVEDALAIQVQPTKEQLNTIIYIGKEVDEAYYKEVLAMQFYPDRKDRACKIVFSSQHGTGTIAIQEVLQRAGYDVTLVKEQCYPDPDFTHTSSANPEEIESYTLALEYAKKEAADLVLVCDPDADRMGAAIRHQEEYFILTGNQCGILLMEYLFSQMKERGCLPENAQMLHTIVTGDLGIKVAQSYGITCEKTLTGFKYIGDRIAKNEKEGTYTCVFGYEESHGYLIKSFVRDKDAPQACLILAEAVSYYKQQGKDLIDVLDELYKRHGLYLDAATSMTFSGQAGLEKMEYFLQLLRKQDLQEIGGYQVVQREDYHIGKRFFGDKEVDIVDIPKANVLKYYLSDGSWIAIRPSGTEPKCKFYYCIKGSNKKEVEEKAVFFQKEIEQYFKD